jgi:hypothetical protein
MNCITARTRALVTVFVALASIGCAGPRIEGGGDGSSPRVEDLEGQACAEPSSVHACAEPDAEQYCDLMELDDPSLTWGPCLAEAECEPGEERECEWGGSETCELYGGVPAWSGCFDGGGEGDTPLVVAFDGAQPELVASSSTFDIAGTGACIVHDWPTAATPWLAIDLDRSGSIDGGHELFGSGTVLADGRRAKDGFEALAQLDSDGDGAITPKDARFGELVLWADHDGDKRSTHAEHESLTARGVVAIPLSFARERRCDARGNCGVERAAAAVVAGVAEVVDLHLPCR